MKRPYWVRRHPVTTTRRRSERASAVDSDDVCMFSLAKVGAGNPNPKTRFSAEGGPSSYCGYLQVPPSTIPNVEHARIRQARTIDDYDIKSVTCK